MEDLQSFNFNVSSLKGKYEVCFESFSDSIHNLIDEKDFIICDSLFFEQSKKVAGSRVISIESNEHAKDFGSIEPIIWELIDGSFDRKSKIIAIGGGVVQDICGFISSILFRGVEWVFFPTTLLSQGDSCIGSKTSINFKGLKNQIGNFYPPSKIIIDTSFLKSLPKEEIKSGMGEMSHYFLIELGESYDFFCKNFNDSKKINEIIYRSLQIKKTIIEIDEFDENERVIFNYGHSFGHALESLSDYKIPHGIAVANGIDIANYISYKTGRIHKYEFYRHRFLISNFWDHFDVNVFFKKLEEDPSRYIDQLKKDKKSVDGKVGLILPCGLEKKLCLINADEDFYKLLQQYPNTRKQWLKSKK